MNNYCGRKAAGFKSVACGDTTIIHYSLFIIHSEKALLFHFAYPVNLTLMSAARIVTVESAAVVRKISL